MRVLHVSGSYFPAAVYGGPIFSIHNLCRFLVREGVEVSVLTTNANGKGVLEYPDGVVIDQDGVKVTYCARSVPVRHVFSLSLWRALKHIVPAFDLVHAHSSFCMHTLWASRKARKEGVPFVISPRGSLHQEYIDAKSPRKKMLWLKLFERDILADADAVHFTSAHEKKYAIDIGLSLKRGEIIPNGIDPEEWEPQNRNSETNRKCGWDIAGPFMLFFGRLSWEKGIHQLLMGLRLVRDEFPDLMLILAGPDNEGFASNIEKWGRELEISGRIRYVGLLNRMEQRYLIERCAFLALTSKSENFGMAAAEAMFFSKPVLLTPGVGIAEDVAREETGIVVPQDAESLAKGIRILMGDKARAQAMGKRGLRLVKENYLWPSIAKKMVGLYEEVIMNRTFR